MNPKKNIDIETLKLVYEKYKLHIRYIIIIFVSFLVFAVTMLPRILQISGLQEARELKEKELEILSGNYRLLSFRDEEMLDTQLAIAVGALPENKDFEGIINAISIAASKSGVSLEDYDFQVGNVLDEKNQAKGFPFTKISLTIRGGSIQLKNFLENLSSTVPLSEVTSIDQSSGVTTLEAVFYFKPSVPSNMSDADELSDLSSEEKEILNTISTWDTFFPAAPLDNFEEFVNP